MTTLHNTGKLVNININLSGKSIGVSSEVSNRVLNLINSEDRELQVEFEQYINNEGINLCVNCLNPRHPGPCAKKKVEVKKTIIKKASAKKGLDKPTKKTVKKPSKKVKTVSKVAKKSTNKSKTKDSKPKTKNKTKVKSKPKPKPKTQVKTQPKRKSKTSVKDKVTKPEKKVETLREHPDINTPAEVRLSRVDSINQEIHRKLNLMGIKDPKQISLLVGAPKDSVVDVGTYPESKSLFVTITHPTFSADRELRIESDGTKTCYNQSFYMNIGKEGTGLGSQVFAKQVKHLQENGFSHITTMGSGGSGDNGYYTWPRMGYNAKINDIIKTEDYKDLGGPNPEYDTKTNNVLKFLSKHKDKTLHDLMSTEKGRQEWLLNGISVDLKFDLNPGSSSMKVHEAYLKERSMRKSTKSSTTRKKKMEELVKKRQQLQKEGLLYNKKNGKEEIVLADWEEDALDRAWDSLSK